MVEESVGWIVSMWTDSSQIEAANKSRRPYLSWSPYDRVTIEKINDFSAFIQTKDFLDWNGTVQRLHLLPMTECHWESGEDSLISIPDSKGKTYGVYCIVTARFKYRFRNVYDIEGNIQKKISDYLEDKEIQWQGFHSLGAEDFVGIFLANSIADLEKVVNFVKGISCILGSKKDRVFRSVYSFMGLNKMDYDEEPKADLLVRLHWKNDHTKQEVRIQLEKELKEHFQNDFEGITLREAASGKGCIEVVISNRKGIFSCFDNRTDAVFNGESTFYKEYIESSRTYWYTIEDDEKSIAEDIGAVEINGEEKLEQITFKDSQIHPVTLFILKEYEKMIDSHRCLWWRPILLNQYKMYVAFVDEYMKDRNQVCLCELTNQVQTALLHINQATAPIYEVPYNNYYYSGSYNDVLRMYYGVIATAFNLAYKLPRDESTIQHEIVYCVDFEDAPKVHSSMYTLKGDSKRFVVFHLPYNAFMHFDKTIKLLLHEIFHYVAPYNRDRRNFVFVEVLVFCVFDQYISILKTHGLKEKNERNITKYFLSEYKEICETIRDGLGNELSGRILNNFTELNKLRMLRHIPEKIFEVIYDKMSREAGLWLKNLKGDCSYQQMYTDLFESNRYEWLLESVRKVASASKEAFCDINMINVLGLNLEEYFELLYDALFYDPDDTKVDKLLTGLSWKKDIQIASFDLRAGMVLDWYYKQNKDSDFDFKQYGDRFRRDIENIGKNAGDQSIYKPFYQYLNLSYNKYLEVCNRERFIFENLFCGELQWKSVYDENPQKMNLREAVTSPNSITNNISTIRNFIDVGVDQRLLNKNRMAHRSIRCHEIDFDLSSDRIVVCNLGQYVEECCKIVQDWDDDLVWYRGVCHDKFSLLPSLFRNLKPNMSLYDNQAKFLQGAYYATISNQDLWTEQQGTTIERMGVLQHYGIPTNLLDFSEDMLTPMHFAINPDRKEDQEKVDQYIFQPVVVLFSPSRYNKAVMSMRQGKQMDMDLDATAILLDIQEDLIKDYCVQDMSEEYIKTLDVETETYVPSPRDMKFPKSIAIRRTNARIQVQKGTFLAYNLHARPEKKDERGVPDYSYLDLRKIQESYLDEFYKGNEREKGMFMKEIYINKQNIPMIKEQLKTMNITTAHAYPELFRIFSEYMEKENRPKRKE